MRAFAHRAVDLIADAFLELYDTALDIRDWARARPATRAQAGAAGLTASSPWGRDAPGWDDLAA